MADLFHWLTKRVDHYRYTAAAVALVLAVAGWLVGCQAKTVGLDGAGVTRTQLERQLADAQAELDRRRVQLSAERERITARADRLRAEVQAEADRLRARAESELADLLTTWQGELDELGVDAQATVRVAELAVEDLAKQEAARAELVNAVGGLAVQLASGAMDPTGIVVTLLGIAGVGLGIGSTADARRKDKVIEQKNKALDDLRKAGAGPGTTTGFTA